MKPGLIVKMIKQTPKVTIVKAQDGTRYRLSTYWFKKGVKEHLFNMSDIKRTLQLAAKTGNPPCLPCEQKREARFPPIPTPSPKPRRVHQPSPAVSTKSQPISSSHWQNFLNSSFEKIGIKHHCPSAQATFIDITNPKEALHASIKGSHIVHGASVPKLAILLAVMKQAEDGEIEVDRETAKGRKNLKTLRMMIRRSNNRSTGAAQRLLVDPSGKDRRGKEATAVVAREYGLQDISAGDGYSNGTSYRYQVWVDKHDQTKRVPFTTTKKMRRCCRLISGKGQAASTDAIASFYQALAHNQLPNNQLMKSILSEQKFPERHFNDRFYSFINKVNRTERPKVKAYRKSGSLPRRILNDSIMVEVPNCYDKMGNQCKFVAVLFTDGCYKTARNKAYHHQLIKRFYNEIKRRYQ
jgi:hypothetical protein